VLTASFPTKYTKLGDRDYPLSLSRLPNPPKTLYYKGCLPDTHNSLKCLGIVGSRRISTYGSSSLRHIFSSLASGSVITVSGFTRGVDVLAHTLSVEYAVPTIAVLPCGVDASYVSSQHHLYSQILTGGGLFISEYPSTSEPKDWMFAKRNRLIAGLCDSLLVVEAGKGSGSLITYDYAKRYKKKVLAVPGDMFRESSAGICQILRDGAIPVFSGSDINKELGLHTAILEPQNLIKEEKDIFSLLSTAPMDMNGLYKNVRLPLPILSTFVTNLQIKGLIKDVKGLFYAIKS
jgi:DNA processing protein